MRIVLVGTHWGHVNHCFWRWKLSSLLKIVCILEDPKNKKQNRKMKCVSIAFFLFVCFPFLVNMARHLQIKCIVKDQRDFFLCSLAPSSGYNAVLHDNPFNLQRCSSALSSVHKCNIVSQTFQHAKVLLSSIYWPWCRITWHSHLPGILYWLLPVQLSDKNWAGWSSLRAWSSVLLTKEVFQLAKKCLHFGTKYPPFYEKAVKCVIFSSRFFSISLAVL